MPVVDNAKAMKSLIREMKTLQHSELRVGVLTNEGSVPHQGDDSGNTGHTVADVFSYPERGRGSNPQRSSLGWVVAEDGKLAETMAFTEKWAGLVVDGKAPAKEVMGVIGEYIIAETKSRIQSSIPPELSEARKEQKVRAGKSGDTPLIETGQLINSFRYEITETIT